MRQQNPTPILSAILVLTLSTTAQAQQQAAPAPAGAASAAATLERVTITTGTRTAKAIDKIPGAINVIGKEEIQRTLLLTEDVTSVLARTVPGYAESTQAMSNTGENLRGRVPLRLFDGVPQGSPLREGTRNGSFTDMGIIGRVEVINGPSASEGIGAAGGIINYISKSPSKKGSEFELTSRYGSQFKDDSSQWKLGLNYAYKSDSFDLLAAAAHLDRGISYDGNGRRIGMNTSGSVSDTQADNIFLKGGFNFGADREQRLQFSASKFYIEGKGNYHAVDGDRATGVTNTSERPGAFGTLAELNDFRQMALNYTHGQLLGGDFTASAYHAKQAMRYLPENSPDRQDPLIAALGTLVDQSEIRTNKKGLRAAWARDDLLGAKGLEGRFGLDLSWDTAEQRLALTNRLWVPPMEYRATEPWLQVSYDIGPLTLSGGVRRENGTLHVDSYTTTFFRNRVYVEGGDLDYTATLPNLGLVWRIAEGWSAFASDSKGFTLPNIGIPLRNVNRPGQSVQGILALQAIIVRNRELGLNWRGRAASFSASVYQSKSDLGQSLSVDPVTNDFLLNRAPVEIKGYELSGEYRPTNSIKLNAAYSHMSGKTWFTSGGPLSKSLGVNDLNPDKLTLSGNWRFSDKGDITLGATTLKSRDLNVGTTAEEHTRGYTLFDLGASYDFGRWGKLALGVDNLFDKFYILSWAQVPGFRNYWSGRGRLVSLTHTVTF